VEPNAEAVTRYEGAYSCRFQARGDGLGLVDSYDDNVTGRASPTGMWPARNARLRKRSARARQCLSTCSGGRSSATRKAARAPIQDNQAGDVSQRWLQTTGVAFRRNGLCR